MERCSPRGAPQKPDGDEPVRSPKNTSERIIFGIDFHKYNIGRTIVGNYAWQQEEEQKGDISIALILQEQLFISELFKDIQDVISLILLYRTM